MKGGNATTEVASNKKILELIHKRFRTQSEFAKAIGCGFGSDCAWQDLEILNDERGKPVMNITGTALQTFEKIGGKTIHLSVSHEKNYATAFVILEGEK